MFTMPTSPPAAVTLDWIPLGAGSRIVPACGRAFETLSARRRHRRPEQLVHAALSVSVGERTYAIEQAAAWGPATRIGDRGVTVTGPVGFTWLGRIRFFRYEIRCWSGGTIPDVDAAIARFEVPTDADRAASLIALTHRVPPHTWGRDEIGVGEMWNSNSVIAWLLSRSGHDASVAVPPAGFRAPGWRSGQVAAASA